MKRRSEPDDMHPEYEFDYSKAKSNRFAGRIASDQTVVLLDPEVSKVFTDELERLKSEDGPAERWEEMTFIEKGKIRTAAGCFLFRQDRQALITTIASGEFDQAFKSSSVRLESK